MRIPIDWLNDYINTGKSVHELEEILTFGGLEVEGISQGTEGEVIEIELTPNRGDCASIIGVARELAAFIKLPCISNTKASAEGLYKFPPYDYIESGKPISDEYTLKIQSFQKCPIYYLKYIRNILVADSPDWLKNRLLDAGVRPLNNVVDITNYVMIELGQPLHAFDAAKIRGDTILVRDADNNEEILLLDGEKRKFNNSDLVISDVDGAVAVAGIMGGADSSVTSSTSDILLESALFDPVSISRTQRRLGLTTEASYRFSRGIDADGVKRALDRATHLISKICHGKPAPDMLFENKFPALKKKININIQKVNKVLGTELTIAESAEYLKQLEFAVKIKDRVLITDVPTWRNDITRPIDVIEEIARIHGYDKIKSFLPLSRLTTGGVIRRDEFKAAVSMLKMLGYRECLTHTIISGERVISRMKPADLIVLANPVNINMDTMRPGLIYGLLQAASYNINQKQEVVRFYEKGPVFFKKNGSYIETPQLAFISNTCDFFESKKTVISTLNSLNQKYKFIYSKNSNYFNLAENVHIEINQQFAGEFGTVSEDLLKTYDLKNSNSCFAGGYILLDSLEKERILNRKFIHWSIYPSVLRDISLVVAEDLTHLKIYDIIQLESGDILKNIRLHDIFRDEKLGVGKKSMTFRLEFNSNDRTLTSGEVDDKIGKILEKLKDRLKITIRPA